MAPAQLVDAKDLPPELMPKPAAQRLAAAAVPAAAASAETATTTAPPAVNGVAATAGSAALSATQASFATAPPAAAAAAASPEFQPQPVADGSWTGGLERDARELLRGGEPQVWDKLTRRFEAQLIRTALDITRGRRIEAAQKLGIGRNTITRKIQELGLDD